MKTNIRSTALEIVPGDIAQMQVDAIANAANNELWMGSVWRVAIKRAGGEAIEERSDSAGADRGRRRHKDERRRSRRSG